jgi:hypothetical protein
MASSGSSGFSGNSRGEIVKLKDMILQVVYTSSDELSLLKIVEEVNKKYDTHTTTREVEQEIRKNRKLFVEVEGCK